MPMVSTIQPVILVLFIEENNQDYLMLLFQEQEYITGIF